MSILGTVETAKYICPFCGRLLREVCQTSCGHHFCKGCLDQLSDGDHGKTNGESVVCPVSDCRAVLKNTDGTMALYFPDRHVQREIELVVVRCPLHAEGCKWEGGLRSQEDHVKNCHPSVTVQPIEHTSVTDLLVPIKDQEIAKSTSDEVRLHRKEHIHSLKIHRCLMDETQPELDTITLTQAYDETALGLGAQALVVGSYRLRSTSLLDNPNTSTEINDFPRPHPPKSRCAPYTNSQRAQRKSSPLSSSLKAQSSFPPFLTCTAMNEADGVADTQEVPCCNQHNCAKLREELKTERNKRKTLQNIIRKELCARGAACVLDKCPRKRVFSI